MIECVEVNQINNEDYIDYIEWDLVENQFSSEISF